MANGDRLDPAQLGLGDMDPESFRAAAHRVADIVADYLRDVESFRVLPDVQPGEVRARFPAEVPRDPEPLDTILADYLAHVQPNITHWQHPGFMAYFCSVASGPGILGEWLAAGLNSNVMFWRNAPASTEVEETVVSWLRQALGLPDAWGGMFTDTASVSSLLSITAARHVVPGLDARRRGLAGRPDAGRLRLYCSEEAHSSIEKAAIVTGVGTEGVRRVPVDDEFRMIPGELDRAIREDREAGWVPFCVVATIGTTSSTSVDPVGEIAEIAARERLWLHVDAAYAGTAALLPEKRPLFAGWEQADSIVVNPHKWMFTPFDASLLLWRRPDVFREAFSLRPEYLRTGLEGRVHDFHEYGIQLGRRFRALKLWLMIRWFGADGMAARVREHCRQARELARRFRETGEWELLAPVHFSTLCIRHVPAAAAGLPEGAEREEALDRHNEAILARVNRDGRIFLSHTRLRGRYTIRVTLGNPRATGAHVELAFRLLVEAAEAEARAFPG